LFYSYYLSHYSLVGIIQNLYLKHWNESQLNSLRSGNGAKKESGWNGSITKWNPTNEDKQIQINGMNLWMKLFELLGALHLWMEWSPGLPAAPRSVELISSILGLACRLRPHAQQSTIKRRGPTQRVWLVCCSAKNI